MKQQIIFLRVKKFVQVLFTKSFLWGIFYIMADDKEKSAIASLRRKLYARLRPNKKEHSGFYEKEEVDVPLDWNNAPEVLRSGVSKKTDSASGGSFLGGNFFTMKKLFITSITFFAFAVLFFLFVILRGSNIISTSNVSILVEGPTSVEAGEEVSLQILIENNNNIALEFSDLLIEYPTGTRVTKNLSEELTRFRRSLGTIPAGKTATETVEAVLFGQEGDEKELIITLEYRAEGSNAIFVVEKRHNIHISASPFVLKVFAPERVSARQEFMLEIELSSRASDAIEDILVFIDYPFGFSFSEASPKPSFSNDTWFLGDLPTDSERKITIRGALEGQDGDDKIFRVEGGIAKNKTSSKMSVVYGSFLKIVRIVRSSLGVSVRVNASEDNTIVVSAGNRVNANITLTNNSPTRIEDVRAEVQIQGEILDKTSVRASGGFYRSIDDRIIWDKSILARLSELAPGSSIELPFSFIPKDPLLSGSRIKNPVISLSISVSGDHLSGEGIFKNVEIGEEREIRVNSDIELTQRAVYYEGPFENSGPIPPKAEQETTYTVYWTIVNTTNDVGAVEVKATLPTYMRWIGAVSPTGENIIYDTGDRLITWSAGDVKAWKGVASSPREVVFRVGLLPSVSQIGQEPLLVGQAELTGKDEFTDAPRVSKSTAATTNLSTDPKFILGNERVVQ